MTRAETGSRSHSESCRSVEDRKSNVHVSLDTALRNIAALVARDIRISETGLGVVWGVYVRCNGCAPLVGRGSQKGNDSTGGAACSPTSCLKWREGDIGAGVIEFRY